MGNIYTKRKVIPIVMKTQEDYNYLKLSFDDINKKYKELLKNKEFECCVCYSNDFTKKINIRCKHPICKRCYKLIPDKLCPLCRKKMIKINSKYTVQI